MSENDTETSGKDGSKKAQFRELVDEYLQPPAADYELGWCKECQKEVWISVCLRPYGMAEQCEEHEPLCHFMDTKQ